MAPSPKTKSSEHAADSAPRTHVASYTRELSPARWQDSEPPAAALSSTDDALAHVCHELRQPVSAIVGWSELLSKGDPMSEARLAQAVAVIARNARSLVRLLDDLMVASSSSVEKLSLTPTPVDVEAAVRACVENIRCAAGAKSVEVSLVVDRGIGTILADEVRLGQILSNLLSNALKFTSTGGRIEVRAHRTSDGIALTVTDDGMGISAGALPHVFDRYWQEGRAGASTPGLGVGLSIVRDLTQRHGGSVHASSGGRGRGATFEVRLPRVPYAM